MRRQLAEKAIEKNSKMYAAFLDPEKAYDKVWREDLWKTFVKCQAAYKINVIISHFSVCV